MMLGRETASLHRLLEPRAIAVIGASGDGTTIGGQPVRHLLRAGYPGRLYPVNPRYREVQGLPCYPDVRQVPDPTPDVALVAVPAQAVPGVLEQSAERGIPYAVLFSAGFSEVGAEGARLQQRIREICADGRIRVVGPNCQGILNIPGRVFAGFGAVFGIPDLKAGSVSLVTQSGGFGYGVVSLAESAGIGFRHVISSGNEADLSTPDFIEHLLDDEATGIVAAYIEGLKDARRLLKLGYRSRELGKPILVWKVGSSAAGRRAALSHTANLSGAASRYRGALRQAGMLEVGETQDLIDLARAFSSPRRPNGPRTAVVTISGGAAVLFADAAEAAGLELPLLSDETVDQLRTLAPPFASLCNPVDVTAHVFNQRGLTARALEVVVSDPGVDSVVVLNASMTGQLAVEVSSAIAGTAALSNKPIYAVWSAWPALAEEAYRILDEAGVPRFSDPVRCARALGACLRFQRARLAGPPGRPPRVDAAASREALRAAGGRVVPEHRAKRFLALAGIPVTREALAASADEAVRVAAEIGYPVVAKVQSAELPHKTEVGGVEVGIGGPRQLREAYDRLMAAIRARRPGAGVDGVLVQEMVRGVETIVGVVDDPQFGPVVLFGLGGVFAELLQDVSCRVAPFDAGTAREMVSELRGARVLEGYRGAPQADVDALAEALARLSVVAWELRDEISELDINPLFVTPEGVRAADALVIRKP